MIDDGLKVGFSDVGEVGHYVEQFPATLGAHAAVGEGERQELMDEHGPTAAKGGNALDPAVAGELDDRDGLCNRCRLFTKKVSVGCSAITAPRASHALEKRGYGAGRVG